MRAAVGFSIHTGWAAAVVLSERGALPRPPWGKDQKDAAALAWGALAGPAS